MYLCNDSSMALRFAAVTLRQFINIHWTENQLENQNRPCLYNITIGTYFLPPIGFCRRIRLYSFDRIVVCICRVHCSLILVHEKNIPMCTIMFITNAFDISFIISYSLQEPWVPIYTHTRIQEVFITLSIEYPRCTLLIVDP